MAERNVKVDFSGGMALLCITVIIILFWGEPDIHDAIIAYLMK